MKHRATYTLIGGALLALALVPAVSAQESDVAAELRALKEGQQQIRKELQEIKKALAARPAAAAAPARAANDVAGKVFNLADNPVKGASTAKLTLVEFTDYQ